MKKSGRVYRAARRIFQPIKQSRNKLIELASLPSRRARISDYLKRPGFKGLQIGSGPNIFEGWLNSDVAGFGKPDVVIDITKSLPFGPNQLDVIYGSEVVEHISIDEAEVFFSEAHRVLTKGGILRLTTPDVDAVCRIALGLNEKSTIPMHATTWLEPDKELTSAVWVNAMFRRWGHQHLWDFTSIRGSLLRAGFAKVERVLPQITQSKFEELANIDNRYGMPPPPHQWESSMILEATK